MTNLSVLIPTTGDLDTVLRHARSAEDLGYRSVSCSHISARDSFVTLAAISAVAPRVGLATAVAPIYHRSPASMAQTAATLDDVSGGRFILGLGTGHRETMSAWHGAQIGKPLQEMREYVAAVRGVLDGQPTTGQTRFNSSFALVGFTPRRRIPLQLAGLSPAMIRLAATIADGLVLWACPAGYVRDVVVPQVREARTAAGLDADRFAITAAMPAAVVEDGAGTPAGVREELHRYFGLPFYRRMFAAAGYAGDLAAFDAADGRDGQLAAIGDALLADLCAFGTPEALRAGVARYQAAGATDVMITHVRGTDFTATLRAAAPDPAR